MTVINIKHSKPWRLQEVIRDALDSLDAATNSQTTYVDFHSSPVLWQNISAEMSTTSLVRETVLLNPATSLLPSGRPTIIDVGSKGMPYQYTAYYPWMNHWILKHKLYWQDWLPRQFISFLGLSNNLGIHENYIVLPAFFTKFTFMIMCHYLRKWQVVIALAKQW